MSQITKQEFKRGMILMWSGLISTIPGGWVLCDGTNSTPDLRNRFIVGADADSGGAAKSTVRGSAAQTGGAATVTLTAAESGLPDHTHTTTNSSGDNSSGNFDRDTANPSSGHTIVSGGVTGGAQNASSAHENCPPFYALAFIMKT